MIVDCTLVSEFDSHFAAQADTGSRLRAMGFKDIYWLMGSGNRTHTWRVSCTEEDYTQLALACVTVSLGYQRELERKLEAMLEEQKELGIKISEIVRKIGPRGNIAV